VEWLTLRKPAPPPVVPPAPRAELGPAVLAVLAALALGLAGAAFALGARSAAATPGDVLYVLEPDLALRAAPRPDGAVKGIMRRGQKVMEFARQADWTRVAVFGAVGLEGWLPTAALGRTPAGDGAALPGGLSESEPSGAEPGAEGETVAAPPRFDLAVDGSPGLSFSGECRLVGEGAAGEERALHGLVPARFRFAAAAIRCILRKRDAFGRLRVTLFRDGDPIARAETAAPYNHVRVRSAGPWGEAAASRGAIPVPRITLPEGQSSLVPPLRGPIVPPLRGPIVPPLRGPIVPPLRGPIVPPLSGPDPTTGGIRRIAPAP